MLAWGVRGRVLVCGGVCISVLAYQWMLVCRRACVYWYVGGCVSVLAC